LRWPRLCHEADLCGNNNRGGAFGALDLPIEDRIHRI